MTSEAPGQAAPLPDTADGLRNYMGDVSGGSLAAYVKTRGGSPGRYIAEGLARGVAGWLPGLPGMALRMVLYRCLLARGSASPLVEAGVELFQMSRIKCGNPPVVYEDGGQTRDFVSVHDVVAANLLALEKSGADYTALNIGSGCATSIKEVGVTLARLNGREDIVPRIAGKFRKGDIRHCYADISKARQLLGFAPSVSFAEGMKQLIEWPVTKRPPTSSRWRQRNLNPKGWPDRCKATFSRS